MPRRSTESEGKVRMAFWAEPRKTSSAWVKWSEHNCKQHFSSPSRLKRRFGCVYRALPFNKWIKSATSSFSICRSKYFHFYGLRLAVLSAAVKAKKGKKRRKSVRAREPRKKRKKIVKWRQKQYNRPRRRPFSRRKVEERKENCFTFSSSFGISRKQKQSKQKP